MLEKTDEPPRGGKKGRNVTHFASCHLAATITVGASSRPINRCYDTFRHVREAWSCRSVYVYTTAQELATLDFSTIPSKYMLPAVETLRARWTLV